MIPRPLSILTGKTCPYSRRAIFYQLQAYQFIETQNLGRGKVFQWMFLFRNVDARFARSNRLRVGAIVLL